jgi:hypothetical protein
LGRLDSALAAYSYGALNAPIPEKPSLAITPQTDPSKISIMYAANSAR